MFAVNYAGGTRQVQGLIPLDAMFLGFFTFSKGETCVGASVPFPRSTNKRLGLISGHTSPMQIERSKSHDNVSVSFDIRASDC
jgi:hypothetical protein